MEGSATQNLVEKLQTENPERNVAFTAIEQLKDESQIQEFFQQYVESLKGKVVNLKYYTPPEGVDLGAMSREQILTMVNMMKRRKLVKFL